MRPSDGVLFDLFVSDLGGYTISFFYTGLFRLRFSWFSQLTNVVCVASMDVTMTLPMHVASAVSISFTICFPWSMNCDYFHCFSRFL